MRSPAFEGAVEDLRKQNRWNICKCLHYGVRQGSFKSTLAPPPGVCSGGQSLGILGMGRAEKD